MVFIFCVLVLISWNLVVFSKWYVWEACDGNEFVAGLWWLRYPIDLSVGVKAQ